MATVCPHAEVLTAEVVSDDPPHGIFKFKGLRFELCIKCGKVGDPTIERVETVADWSLKA